MEGVQDRLPSPTFEVTSKPWFGPRARAKQILSQTATEPAAPNEAIRAMRSLFGASSAGITHIRFIDFVYRQDGFRYRIAVCWTADDPSLRDALYDGAKEFAQASGWYLLPQGTRLGSLAKERKRRAAATPSVIPSLPGQLQTLEAATRPEDGCSVRLRLDQGASILLDTGLPGRLAREAKDSLILITHAHADHTGGLTTGRCGDAPAIMSEVTADLLLAGGHLNQDDLENRVVLTRPGTELTIGPGLRLETFAVPHLPGAIGWTVSDAQSAVIFTGDICLTTARHSFLPRLRELALLQHPKKVTVMLDATMAGRRAGASGSPAARQLTDSQHGEVVVLAGSGEHLLYAYLDLFHEIQQSDARHSASFIVSSSARPLFELLHAAFIGRRVNELDPFILGQYGTTMSSWGESRWLFWADRMRSVPTNRKLWFLTYRDLHAGIGPESAFAVSIGRDDTGEDLGVNARWSMTEGIDTTAWTLHSNEHSLVEACNTLQDIGCRVVLFHNFSGRMKKFVRDQSLTAEPLSGSIALTD